MEWRKYIFVKIGEALAFRSELGLRGFRHDFSREFPYYVVEVFFIDKNSIKRISNIAKKNGVKKITDELT